ncbi:hypothetical protein D6745_03950 [Candidatus Woesearchaeota archaeon]|nr:MAG: hypothetical protein D6745_03950 [Candidatus Woesearchaeota archaeon]
MGSNNKLRRLLREELERKKSRRKWEDSWRKQGFMFSSQSAEPSIKWFYDREIRIYRMPSINPIVVPYVKEGIEELIREVGLDISVFDCGIHDSVIRQVEMSLENGLVNPKTLANILGNEDYRDPEKGGSPHADVVLVDRGFFNDPTEYYWGNSNFRTGHVIITLQGNRQQYLGYIKNIAKHEANHLLGNPWHHDDPLAQTKGYANVKLCNTLKSAPILSVCEKCFDAIKYFWIGVRERTGVSYFRTSP